MCVFQEISPPAFDSYIEAMHTPQLVWQEYSQSLRPSLCLFAGSLYGKSNVIPRVEALQ